jgi:hypothetical protein
MIKACGHLVVSLYEGNVRPRKITRFTDKNVYISSTVKGLQPNIVEYECSDVIGGTNPPKLVSKKKKGFYSLPEVPIFCVF